MESKSLRSLETSKSQLVEYSNTSREQTLRRRTLRIPALTSLATRLCISVPTSIYTYMHTLGTDSTGNTGSPRRSPSLRQLLHIEKNWQLHGLLVTPGERVGGDPSPALVKEDVKTVSRSSDLSAPVHRFSSCFRSTDMHRLHMCRLLSTSHEIDTASQNPLSRCTGRRLGISTDSVHYPRRRLLGVLATRVINRLTLRQFSS